MATLFFNKQLFFYSASFRIGLLEYEIKEYGIHLFSTERSKGETDRFSFRENAKSLLAIFQKFSKQRHRG